VPARAEGVPGRLVGGAEDLILVLDAARDRVRWANRRARELLGYGLAELRAMPIAGLGPPGDAELAMLLRAVERQGQGWTAALPLRTKAGAFIPAELLALRLLTRGRPCVLVLARDRSEHRGRGAPRGRRG
jgi:PAS domain-containing protein